MTAKCPICSNNLNLPEDNYDKSIITKPWGYEYLCFENEYVGIWLLHINPNCSTSMHCHPKKTTGLIVLDGTAEVSFFNNKQYIKAGQKIMIRRGMFHSTYSPNHLEDCSNGITLLEVETPKDKHDLIRLKDKYGRELQPYEDETHELPKPTDALWITNNPYIINNSIKICLTNLADCDLNNSMLNMPIIFVNGGLSDSQNRYVVQPGDVVTGQVINMLLQSFKPSINTEVITIQII